MECCWLPAVPSVCTYCTASLCWGACQCIWLSNALVNAYKAYNHMEKNVLSICAFMMHEYRRCTGRAHTVVLRVSHNPSPLAQGVTADFLASNSSCQAEPATAISHHPLPGPHPFPYLPLFTCTSTLLYTQRSQLSLYPLSSSSSLWILTPYLGSPVPVSSIVLGCVLPLHKSPSARVLQLS